jgi:hypothetical protein
MRIWIYDMTLEMVACVCALAKIVEKHDRNLATVSCDPARLRRGSLVATLATGFFRADPVAVSWLAPIAREDGTVSSARAIPPGRAVHCSGSRVERSRAGPR